MGAADRNAAIGVANSLVNAHRVRIPPFKRAPGRTDDTSHGYQVGDFWNFGGKIFQAQDVTANAAVWTLVIQDPKTCALDAVPTALAAYGMIKLRSGYAGNCCQIKRASDSTTLNVGFVWNPGVNAYVVDVEAIDAFLTGTTGVFTTWYDQSGNAQDAAQATAANQPNVRVITRNGIRVLSLESETTTNTKLGLDLPGTLTVNRRAAMGILVANTKTSAVQNVAFWFGTTASNPTDAVGLASGFNSIAQGWISEQPGSDTASNQIVRAGMSITALELDTAARRIRQNDRATSISATATTGTTTGGGVGKATTGGGYCGRMEMLAFIVYGRVLSSTERATLWPLLYAQCGIVPQYDVNVVYDGDSITYGAECVLKQPRMEYSRDYLGEELGYINLGIGGQTAATIQSGFSSAGALCVVTGKTNIYDLFAGTNDLNNGDSGATVYARLQALVTAARAAGYTYVKVNTVLPRTSLTGAKETERQNLNTLLRAGKAGADLLGDFAADPTMGAVGNLTNATYYYAGGGTHPTDFGHSFLAAIDAPIYAALLPKA